MFTHFGISGPLVLSASAHMDGNLKYKAVIDLKPYIDHEELDRRMLREFDANKNRDLQNVLAGLLPKKLISVIIDLCDLKDRKISGITVEERKRLCEAIKSIPLTVTGLRPIEEAVVTRGGVDVKEVNPKTMESRLVDGLYFAGEILDVDAYTGGFNLQIAFSTGFLAGNSV